MESTNRPKVFVVEDLPATAADLRDELHRTGYEVTGIAASGEEALERIGTNPPDMVVLGVHFQDQPEGLETAELVTARYNIPVRLAGHAGSVDATDTAGEAGLVEISAAVGILDPSAGGSEIETRKKLSWLSGAVNSAGDGIVIVDPRGRVQFLNALAQQLTGCTQQFAVGRHYGEVLVLEHNDERITDDLVRLAILNGDPLSLGRELRLLSRDGQRHHVEAEVSASGEVYGVLGSVVFTFRDIGQRKWEEDQSRQEHAIRAVERLAETTAHTLNNMLTAILGNGELLLNNPSLSEDQRAGVTHIYNAAQSIADVVRRLSKISRTKFATRQELNINSVIESFRSMLAGSLPSNVHLKLALDPAIGKVSADRSQIEQVLFNLVINSRDALPNGGEIVVSTTKTVLDSAERSLHARSFVGVSVRDNGEGMSDETLQRIFEPFFTLRNATGHPGLGLSITQGIIRDYKGFLDVKSELGVGTEVTFGLPCVTADPFSYLDQQAEEADTGGAKTILVVEDDHAVRLLIKKILEKRDYKVIEAADGEDALMVAQLHEGSIALLVTGVSMPGISGPDLIRQFAPLHPETKYLLISGFSSEKIGATSMPTAIEFLRKPFTQNEMLERIHTLMAL